MGACNSKSPEQQNRIADHSDAGLTSVINMIYDSKLEEEMSIIKLKLKLKISSFFEIPRVAVNWNCSKLVIFSCLKYLFTL